VVKSVIYLSRAAVSWLLFTIGRAPPRYFGALDISFHSSPLFDHRLRRGSNLAGLAIFFIGES
jgi:hypothetical protein